MPQGSLSIVNYQLSIKCITIMKKLLLLLLAALGGSMSASAQFSLSGRIDGMPDSLRVTVVNVENPDKATLLCETAPQGGTFTLASDSLVRSTLCELRVMRRNPKVGRFIMLYSTRFLASATAMQAAPVSMDALEAAAKDSRTEQAFKISGGQAQADWRKAMGEEKMTWTQGWLDKEQMDKPANAYALISIPRLILIDREGRIVCSTNLPDEITEYLQKHITQ